MTLTLDTGNVLGLLGVVFSFASFTMKRMLPLRILAVASNICFIGYGLAEWLLPSLVLNAALLPVNLKRFWDIRKLTDEIKRARHDSPVSKWLLPHMMRRPFKAGEVLFRQGDAADSLFYVASGQLRVSEIGRTVGVGELIGEIGLFSPDRIRTQSLVCETDGELYYINEEMMFQLYYLHPQLGFYLMRLLAERLSSDVRRQQAALAQA